MVLSIQSTLVLAFVLVPQLAFASTPSRSSHSSVKPHGRRAHLAKRTPGPRPCAKAPVEVVAGKESATISLSRCEGEAASAGADRLSMLARAHGTARLDPRLVDQLELAVEHFHDGSATSRVVIVSGYRPQSAGSYHAKGRALDFRIEGVANEALVAFCKTMPDTGCGYYPNSGFVHMDVREPGTGHIAWTDVSRPGEAPKYVTHDATTDAPSPTGLPPLPAERGAVEKKSAKRAERDGRPHSI